MLLPPRKLVGLLVVSTWPTACVLPEMNADIPGAAKAGQSSIGLGGANAGNSASSQVTNAGGGGNGGRAAATSGGAAGNNAVGGSSSTAPTSTGGTGTVIGVGGVGPGGSNSGGVTTRPTGGNTGLGGSNLAGGTNATGGTSNAGSGGKSTIIAAGGTSNPATATGGTSNLATGGSSVGGTGARGGTSSMGGSSNVGGASNTSLVPTKITTGFYTSCAVKGDGTAFCWGTEYCGALGNGSDGNGKQACGFTGWYNADDYLHVTLEHSPVQVRGVTNAVAMARGISNMHNCVLRSSGTVSCWGWNAEGELGDNGSESWSTLPVTVKNLTNVVNVVVGSDHSCALLADTTVKCWGTNVDGAIGNGDPCSSGSCSDIPATTVLVAAGTPLDQVHNIYSGAFHTCALRNDGSVWCWGYNVRGQLGNGTTDAGRFATRSNFPQALDVTTGSQFTCVRAVDNSLWCAGYNDYGGFGIAPPTPDPSVPIPTPVKSLSFTSPLVALTAGTYNTCAIVALVGSSSNVTQCWGYNWTGQLGDGTFDSSLNPVSAVGMSNATEIAAGSTHTCAVQAGSVYCWGNNDAGQIGTTTTGAVLQPTKVEGLQL